MPRRLFVVPVLALVLVAAAFAAFAAGGDDSREASFNARGGGTAG